MKEWQLPSIVVGTWSWGNGINGGDMIFGDNPTERELKPVFDAAMNAGFNLLDTAAVYGMGSSETIVGNFIQEKKDVFISTKFTPRPEQSDHALENMLMESLNRLQIDYVDLYWIHNPNDVERWTSKLIPLMKSGKIKYAGVSNHNLEEIKLAAAILEKEGLQLSAVQNHYSLLYRASEKAGIIDWCQENNVVFFSYMVLEQGALTGTYSTQNPFKSGTRRGDAFTSDILQKLDGLINVMRTIGNKYGVGCAQIAIAWAIAKGTVPIIGVTKIKHVTDAKSAVMFRLTEQEIKQIEDAAKETGVEVQGAWEKSMQ